MSAVLSQEVAVFDSIREAAHATAIAATEASDGNMQVRISTSRVEKLRRSLVGKHESLLKRLSEKFMHHMDEELYVLGRTIDHVNLRINTDGEAEIKVHIRRLNSQK